ncbi:DUF3159 domain-containing protein [Actinopolymorpha sp. B17G11]|uniref:DUF3159 domain-containing protein n=1 Tax=unclassified Actinopolymorpha TaxID=2627063 RepID=UPI0032D905B9
MTDQQPAEQQRVDEPEPSAQEGFSLVRAFGGWGGMLDAGIPGVAFLIAYTVSGQDLRLALIIALSVGAVLAVIRLVRRDPLQNIIGGFIGVAIAALIANATGKAEDFYLPGLFINAGYAVAYLVGNLLRWPLIGLIVGFAAGWGTTWRQDPVLLSAFMRAGWLWVGLFAVKLAVQLPLYLAGEVVALGIARVALGWPLWLLVLWLSYIVIKGSVPREHWAAVKQAADKIGQARGGS